MRKKQKEGEVLGDEKKDADEDADDDKQKKKSSPAHESSSPQYLDSASGPHLPPPGYCTYLLLIV